MKLSAASIRRRVALVVVLAALCALLGSQTAPREQVGPLPGGGFLLNSGWRLDPVGKQIPLDTLPMSTRRSRPMANTCWCSTAATGRPPSA